MFLLTSCLSFCCTYILSLSISFLVLLSQVLVHYSSPSPSLSKDSSKNLMDIIQSYISSLSCSRYFSQFARQRSEEQRLNSSHVAISYAVFCLKNKKTQKRHMQS